jgi:hypothetical protein
MPQWRKLHIKATESLDINDMPDDFTRLLWITLPLIVCREGRGIDSPCWIKSKAMPLRGDIDDKHISKAMTWYAERGMIQRYMVAGRHYFSIVKWHEHQGDTSREARSLYPEPVPDTAQNHSGVTQELFMTDSCSDADADAEEIHVSNATDFHALLAAWRELFPKKPQPRPETKSLQSKAAVRFKDTFFRENWRKALEKVSHSDFCLTGGWFDLGWFLKNDENWQKCLNGNYDKPNGNGRTKPDPYIPPFRNLTEERLHGSNSG